jgi:hypothetical protein
MKHWVTMALFASLLLAVAAALADYGSGGQLISASVFGGAAQAESSGW